MGSFQWKEDIEPPNSDELSWPVLLPLSEKFNPGLPKEFVMASPEVVTL